MKKNLQLSTLFFFLALAGMSLTSADCNPDVDPGLAAGEMKASSNVEGTFFADDVTAVTGSTYVVSASMPYSAISGDIEISLGIPKNATVPYTVNVSNSDAVINYCLKSANLCTTFIANKTTGSGTITITSISPYIEGTFSGTLAQVGGAQSRIISGGEFKGEF
jgi:hypothetical protein